MNKPRVLAVGSPPNFRREVAHALDESVELVPWVQSTQEAVLSIDASGSPDLMVISAEVNDEEAIELSQHVSTRSPTTAVVLMRNKNPNGHLPAFVRAGVRDLVDVEQGPGELREALRRAVAWSRSVQGAGSSGDSRGSGGMLVTAFSSKGGVGKSFLACNVAAALARKGNETALVDLDLVMGDTFSYFGAESQRPLQDLVALGENVDKDTLTTIGTALGDHLWAFGSPPDIAAEHVPASSMLACLNSIKAAFAYTVVDVPAGYGEEVLAAFDASDFVCLIAGLDVVGIKHLSKALETLAYLGVSKDRLMVVLNRADSKVGLQPADVERILDIKIDAMIPSSRLVPAALNKGRPVVLEDPKSPVSQSLDAFAAKLAAVTADGEQSGASPHRKKRFSFGKA